MILILKFVGHHFCPTLLPRAPIRVYNVSQIWLHIREGIKKEKDSYYVLDMLELIIL
jgi:hypothetical protein